MKKRAAAGGVLVLGLFCLPSGIDHFTGGEKPGTAGKRANASQASGDDAETTRLPTKVSNRPADASTQATHRPERLKEFFLPEAVIEGLPLDAALAKLRTAYEEVCRESGEVPLRLTFVVPPEATRPLTVKTGPRNLDASIHLLAALAGLKVSRAGSEFVFIAPEETGETVSQTFKVSPDFFSRSSAGEADPFSEDKVPVRLSPAEYFARKGLTLDRSTKFSRGVTTLRVESASAADRAAIEGLIDVTLHEVPLQHKLEAHVVHLPAGVDWMPPDFTQLEPDEMQLLMRQLAQKNGVEIMVTPSTTARSGQNSKIAVTREVLVPSEIAPGGFEVQDVGLIADLRPVPYGFGHRVDLAYTERVAEGESGTPSAKVSERTSITDSSISGDGNARVHVQTHPDGSRSVVLVTPTLVDPTGHPIHPKE